ncbi:MAG: right-handed parallel beta-helix repeat-containing protein [Candidatus Babeliales bacterium]
MQEKWLIKLSLLILFVPVISFHAEQPKNHMISLYDLEVEAVLSPLMAEYAELLPITYAYYKNSAQGQTSFSSEELSNVISELSDFIETYSTRSGSLHGDRGSRPDAPPLIANDAVVGKSCCDLTQVIALLGALKKLLIKIEFELCEKFEFTWSILDKIDIDINGIFTAIDAIQCPTVDLSGIFTALEFGFYDTQTILCEKFEFTWSALEKIDIDVNGIYTVLENLTITLSVGELTINATIDLSGVFTALEFGFYDTQTILCEKFEFTWSALEKIDIDVNGIFTALNDITINATVDVDLSGVFTALEFGFYDTQTILCEKFEFTWSALEKIDIDINGIFTALNDITINATVDVDLSGVFTALEFGFYDTQTILCEKFEFTWSALEKIDIDVNGIFTALNDITINATVDVDLSGVFTALEFGFYDTQTILCEKFEFTWSALEKIDIDVNGIFTALNDITINATVDVDLSGVFTALEFGFYDTQTILCEKFEFTWSILDKIDIDVNGIFTAIDAIQCPTVDLSGIFTALEFGFYDTQTIICEKFEFTWSALEKIDIDINGIFTALNDITINASVDVDLSGVFTALEFGFYDTQTILCEKFEFTWSALEKIDIDINGIFTAIDAIQCPTVDLSGIFTALEFGFYDTQTILCEKFEFTWSALEKIDIDINGIFTALNDITINATVDVDLSGVFTALEFGFYDTQTILCEKFEFTWSALEKIDIDVNGIFTALNDITINATVDVDLSGVFTALEFGFYDTQTILCEKFEFTWSALEKIDIDINGIFTAIDAIQCPTVDLSGIFTALEFGFYDTQTIICEKFEQTWTILNALCNGIEGLQASIDDLCCEIFDDFEQTMTLLVEIKDDIFETQTILCSKFEQTWTILDAVCNKFEQTWTILACNVSVPISAATTISNPGTYCLINDIVGTITIAADSVTLDLNGKSISGGANGVYSSNHTDITIKNGLIKNATENGIKFTNVTDISIFSIKLRNNTKGIALNSVKGGFITESIMLENATGLELVQTSKVFVKNCIAQENTIVGFSLVDSDNNTFKECTAMCNGLSGNDSAYGFISDNGRSNIFEQCNAQGTITTQTTLDFVAAGFALTGSEMCTKIISCESFDNTTPTTGFAIPYGILLTYTFTVTDLIVTDSVTVIPAATVASVNWSPNGKFLAIGSFGSPQTRIYAFDGINLMQVATAVHGILIRSVNWSPDSKYLAIGGGFSGGVQVRVYAFSGVSLTQVASAAPALVGSIASVNWSPDGKYLAVGGTMSDIFVYAFDGVSLTQVASEAPGAIVNSVNWSPDGKYLAIGRSSGEILVYAFDGVNLTQVATETLAGSVNSVNWSPNCKFLATGLDSGPELRVYAFSGVSLTQVATGPVGTPVLSVDWSPDGKFLITGGSAVRVYAFNGLVLTQVATAAVPMGMTVFSVDWSPDGSYIGLGKDGSPEVIVYNAFAWEPTRNIIKNNLLYCNVGNECPGGVGISGSSLKNLIIGNTAYENTANYEFVTNVYKDGINNSPSTLENVSVPPY